MPSMLCLVSQHVVGYNSFHVLTNYVNISTVDLKCFWLHGVFLKGTANVISCKILHHAIVSRI